MSAVLLDTHVVVWAVLGMNCLSPAAQRLVQQADSLLVSAVSIFEIDYKRSRPRRSEPDPTLARLPADLTAFLPSAGFVLVDLTPAGASRAARLPMSHGDPIDRMLVAQALVLGVPLISVDRILREQAADTPVIW